ncbi:unnamed protein product [Symbiodinium sp. CCMP2592]|nr:unnamed protein product [Symbiodinium sp. CCMP2592]
MSDNEVDEEETLEICKVTCVRSAKFSAWYPNVKLVDGIEYLNLSPWDKDLCRFTTGIYMQMKKKRQQPKHNIHVRFFPETKARRKEACNEALKAFLYRAADEAHADRPEKVRNAREEDSWIVSRTVAVTMPDIGEGPLVMTFLWGITSALFMQLTVANLKYVRAAIRASPTIVRGEAAAERRMSGRKVGRPCKVPRDPVAALGDGDRPGPVAALGYGDQQPPRSDDEVGFMQKLAVSYVCSCAVPEHGFL